MSDDKHLELAEREFNLMRDSRDFWREECRKRAEKMRTLPEFRIPGSDWVFCAACGEPMGKTCENGQCLRIMPEEPKQ